MQNICIQEALGLNSAKKDPDLVEFCEHLKVVVLFDFSPEHNITIIIIMMMIIIIITLPKVLYVQLFRGL